MYPLVIVKSAQSSCEYYEKTLQDISGKRICEGAVNALQLLETTPAQVVIVEADMDDMNGIEVAETIRDIDTDAGHFTYFILTGKQLPKGIQEAFAKSVDAWADAGDSVTLRNAVRAGSRISERINQLNDTNRRLLTEREGLIKGQLLDPLTGLGNRRYAELAMSDSARHIESRGGALCFLLIEVGNYQQVRDEYDDQIAGELIVAVGKRIQHLVRPMDIVTYFAPGRFALVLVQPTIEQCVAECYQRIFDGVRLKSYKTDIGFLDVQIGMSICGSLGETGAPHIDTIVETAEANLPEALGTQKIVVRHLNVQ